MLDGREEHPADAVAPVTGFNEYAIEFALAVLYDERLETPWNSVTLPTNTARRAISTG